jgi:3-(3-hydroxy-phenyl)propionate hydroxylase
LTAALALLRQDIPVTVVEASTELPTDPRASTFHPPTMQMLETIDVADALHAMGLEIRKWQYRDRRKGLIAEFDLGVLGSLTKYTYRLHCEQWKYARLLLERVRSHRLAEVVQGWRVAAVRQNTDGVEVDAEADGRGRTFRGTYVIGADGGRSTTRQSLGVTFEGLTFQERFLVLTTTFNFEPHGFAGTCYCADPELWCSTFRVPAFGPPGHWRVVFPVLGDAPEKEVFEEERCQALLQSFFARRERYEIVHKNLYTVHQRIAGRFRVGRVFLAGDAAHINNPLGGMGLNFGIHDALNAAEKIGKVWRREAGDDLFDLYDRQRRTVAQEYLLAQTAQNKRDLEEKDPVSRAKAYEKWRRSAADPERTRDFLMRTAMFDSVRRAGEIS